MVVRQLSITYFAISDGIDRQKQGWISDSGMYGKWTRLWRILDMERLSEIMPVRQIDNDYPIKRDSGHFKLTFSDFNSSLTYRFSRHSWPIIPIFDLFSLPIQESKYESFYITFINLAHATEPNTPLRDLQFIFWTDKSQSYFHETVFFQSDFHPDKNILNLLGSYVFTINEPLIYRIPREIVYYVTNYCTAVGELVSLVL